MKLVPKFTKADIKATLQEMVDQQIDAVIHKLHEIGLRVVKAQRLTAEGKDYWDQSGNLRSSIGYVITYGSKELAKGGFEPTPNGSEGGKQGQQDGLNFARSIAGKYKGNGLQLVVVAGMNYARAVHVKKYDVLSTAELVAERMINDFKKKGM